MSDALEALLNPLNVLVVLLQIAVLVDAVSIGAQDDKRRLARQAAAPSLLTGLGILGTFAGILWGLLGFDVTNIQESVPKLLGGMTTAFFTSVVGLIFALSLRFSYRYFDRFHAVREAAGHSISDVYTILSDTLKVTQSELSSLRSEMEKLRLAIGGDNDSSLQSQTKLMRGEVRDRLDTLNKGFVDFAQKVSELGTKALIEALSEVIRDFNTKLTEQFGENFKELNAAVLKLVTWQENYASQISLLEEQFRATAAGLRETGDIAQRIATAAETIPSLMVRTSESVARLEAHQRELDTRLAAFATLADKAKSAVPIVEQNIERLSTGVEQAVATGLKLIGDAQREQRDAQLLLSKAYENLVVDTRKTVADAQASGQALREAINASLSTLESQLREHHSRSAQNWERTLTDSVARSDEVMQQQVKNLDQTLGREIERTVNQLGRHLLGLHDRLVSDYTPLLEAMRRVVELQRRADGRS